jgi:hypothetical protein
VEWLICCDLEFEYQFEAIIIVGGLTLYLTQADIFPSLSYNKVPLHRIDRLKKNTLFLPESTSISPTENTHRNKLFQYKNNNKKKKRKTLE